MKTFLLLSSTRGDVSHAEFVFFNLFFRVVAFQVRQNLHRVTVMAFQNQLLLGNFSIL